VHQIYTSDEAPPPIPRLALETTLGRQYSSPTSPSSPMSPLLRPKRSITHLTSFDQLLNYRADVSQWKRASSILESRQSYEPTSPAHEKTHSIDSEEPTSAGAEAGPDPTLVGELLNDWVPPPASPEPQPPVRRNKFRHICSEIGFCFSIAMAQLLGEFLISGFALELTNLSTENAYNAAGGNMGLFWPATLLSLILSATLLVFARLSDMYGGYVPFMFGLGWLGIWTMIPAFVSSLVVLDVSRAMQGLAIAAFTPSTFVMVSSYYEEGRRKNLVLGLYSGCAPIGFFVGFLTAGALPASKAGWYFWVVGAAAFTTAIISWFSIPHDWTDRKQLNLRMDWLGALSITAGLILVAYALSASTYATGSTAQTNWSHPSVYAPFAAGIVCLAAAVWVEGWYAATPLLPLKFFQKRSVAAFCLAGLCFYASYGVWLYTTTEL
jgi:MFS family permease